MSANLMSLVRSGGKFLKLFGDRKMMKTMPTARDYVQDGLIAMWDGIENAGWGLHNPNATEWKQLMTSSTNYDLVVPADKAMFTQDSLVTSVKNAGLMTKKFRYLNGFLEAVVKAQSAFNGAWVGLENPQGLSSYVVNGVQRVTLGALAYVGYACIYELGKRFNVCGNLDYKDPRLMCLNGKTVDEKEEVNYMASSGRWFSYAPIGTEICCVRIYNRDLSLLEVTYNYSIDKARFNLPD